KKYGLTREQLDNYALQSYKKAQEATDQGKFKSEIVPIQIRKNAENIIVDKDEDIYKLVPEKVSLLKPAFETNGNLTAANSSNINESAAVLLLASKVAVNKYKLKAVVIKASSADAAQAPEWSTTAPRLAITRAFKRANTALT